MYKAIILIIAITLLSPVMVSADAINLTIPRIAESPSSGFFFEELITQSLKAQGHELVIKIKHTPQKRALHLLNHNKLDLLWLLASKERQEMYNYIPVNLTNGLIGQRVFLIKPSDQHKFNSITTLDDLQKSSLTAVFGSGWFDNKVWGHNQLNYIEDKGNWHDIYRRLSNNRLATFDYFPRGVNEITKEAAMHPSLKIEEKLLLVYERDFQLFLSKRAQKYYSVLYKSLKAAKDSGLIDTLVAKYWEKDIRQLKLNQRIRIPLATPL